MPESFALKPLVHLDGVTTLRLHVFCMSLSVKDQRIQLKRLQSHGRLEIFSFGHSAFRWTPPPALSWGGLL